MKKTIITTSLVLTIALLAAACGNKAKENANALSQKEQFLVGLGGLEPPTSPLSGVRSNHLSYKPLL